MENLFKTTPHSFFGGKTVAEKILIIDDDLDTTRLVCLMIQKMGYQTVVANDGQQGLLETNNENPDLVLLDVMMPDMDGYEVARRLRNNPKTTQIPILMFTAKSQADDKVTGYAAGADDYLTNPPHPTQLLAHVKALLERTPKMEKGRSTTQGKRTYTENLVNTRFATWFENTPSHEVKNQP